MRLQIASDLHLEAMRQVPQSLPIAPVYGADLLILAGDIASHTHGIRAFLHWPVPVAYVHGNHEPAGVHYWGMVRELARAAQGSRVAYLECSTIEMPALRILGCCLWTDYALYGMRAAAMREAARSLPDHQSIRVAHGQRFLPVHALAEHQKARAWLSEQLGGRFSGKTVVVTHHAPHPLSIHPKFRGDVLSAAFASDLTPLMEKVDLWIHGHIHTASNYTVGRCRVVCNPRGYPRVASPACSDEQLLFENEAFDPLLVVDV
ncbi:metallophosphoesterase [Paraburkholderia youngii]|uniref:metallophosphoesterase n=1 Tax=Paraburkholderia youngii TaxID=2782701 RepID=UPI003D19D720